MFKIRLVKCVENLFRGVVRRCSWEFPGVGGPSARGRRWAAHLLLSPRDPQDSQAASVRRQADTGTPQRPGTVADGASGSGMT